jgi:hypothetical protein
MTFRHNGNKKADLFMVENEVFGTKQQGGSLLLFISANKEDLWSQY